MKLPFRVDYADGRQEILTATAPDIIRFEDEFDLSITKVGENVRMKHLAYLCWLAAKRTETTTLEFDGWLDTVESITDVSSGADPIPPLEMSPPTGS